MATIAERGEQRIGIGSLSLPLRRLRLPQSRCHCAHGTLAHGRTRPRHTYNRTRTAVGVAMQQQPLPTNQPPPESRVTVTQRAEISDPRTRRDEELATQLDEDGS